MPAKRVEKERGALPFLALMFFTFVLFVGPQYYLPVLQPLRLAALLGGLALVTYALDRFSTGRPLTVTIPPVRLVVALLILAIASIPTSLWPGGSFETLTNDLLKAVLIFFLLANTVDTPRRMKLLIGSLVCWGTIMAVSAARDFSGGTGALQGVRISGYDSALAGNPNDLAFTLNIIIALALGLHSTTKSRSRRWLLVAAIAMMVWGIIATFSRSGFLTLVAVALVFVGTQIRGKNGAIVIGTLVLAGCLLMVIPGGYGHRLYSMFDFEADATGSAQARWEGYFIGLDLIEERPLLGFGLNANGLAFVDRGKGWTGLHNAYLQVGADCGVPAMIVFVLIVWRLFRGVTTARSRLRTVAGAEESVGLGSGIHLALVAYAVGALFEPVAYLFYFFYPAGLAVAFQVSSTKLAQPQAAREIPSNRSPWRHARTPTG